jgi:hypothetical protein
MFKSGKRRLDDFLIPENWACGPKHTIPLGQGCRRQFGFCAFWFHIRAFMQHYGAGELFPTSMDRDGTNIA